MEQLGDETIEQLRAERDRYREALKSLLTMQGHIIPVWNEEMVPVSWVFDVVEPALNPDTSDQPATATVTA